MTKFGQTNSTRIQVASLAIIGFKNWHFTVMMEVYCMRRGQLTGLGISTLEHGRVVLLVQLKVMLINNVDVALLHL